MKRFVRESKYRHIFGQAAPKDLQFEGVNVSMSRLEGNFCAVNTTFIAVVLNSTGAGVFTVLNRDKPGRYDVVPRCTGHTSEILELSFDPFNHNRLISGDENGNFLVWWIPDEGISDNHSEYLASLRVSQRRAVQAVWHSSAVDIVHLVWIDKIVICELERYTTIKEIDTSQYCDQLFNVSFNLDCTKVALSFRDKKVRIINVDSEKLEAEFESFDGAKPSRVQYLYGFGDMVFVTGFTKMSERKLAIWDIKNCSQPLTTQEIDNGVAVLNMNYDPDSHLIAVYGKGDTTVRIYELEESGQCYLVSVYQAGEQQKSACFANKLGCNAAQNEIMHFVKCTGKGVEPVSLTVPRKSELFQDDLFPDTQSDKPALTAKDYVAGKRANPLKISIKDYTVSTGATAPVGAQMTATINSSASVIRASPSTGRRNDLEARVAELEKTVKDLQDKLTALSK